MKVIERDRLALAEMTGMGISDKAHLMEPVHVAGRRLQRAIRAARQELERFLVRFAESELAAELERLTEPLLDAEAELNSRVFISPTDLLEEFRHFRQSERVA